MQGIIKIQRKSECFENGLWFQILVAFFSPKNIEQFLLGFIGLWLGYDVVVMTMAMGCNHVKRMCMNHTTGTVLIIIIFLLTPNHNLNFNTRYRNLANHISALPKADSLFSSFNRCYRVTARVEEEGNYFFL